MESSNQNISSNQTFIFISMLKTRCERCRTLNGTFFNILSLLLWQSTLCCIVCCCIRLTWANRAHIIRSFTLICGRSWALRRVIRWSSWHHYTPCWRLIMHCHSWSNTQLITLTNTAAHIHKYILYNFPTSSHPIVY